MLSRNIFKHLIAITVLISACEGGIKKIFVNKSARESYADKLHKISSLKATQWKNAGIYSLEHPLELSEPYSESIRFTGNTTDVVAWRIHVKGGQQLTVTGTGGSSSSRPVYADLFEVTEASANTAITMATLPAEEILKPSLTDKIFLLRLQPELGDTSLFSLSIELRPLLRHPIDSNIKSNIGSFWGADRDGGKRNHEGIDIFAKKGSPAVAVANGTVTRVNETAIGGKVVWLRPAGQAFSVYYAHLDSQLVTPGQTVEAGQAIGLVGNTGNARTTAAHLHFGIYGFGGAVDPLYFIKSTTAVSTAYKELQSNWYRLSANASLYPAPGESRPLSSGKSLVIRTLATSSKYYRILLPDSTQAYIPSASLSEKQKL